MRNSRGLTGVRDIGREPHPLIATMIAPTVVILVLLVPSVVVFILLFFLGDRRSTISTPSLFSPLLPGSGRWLRSRLLRMTTIAAPGVGLLDIAQDPLLMSY